MATISEMFTTAINEANKTVKTITDPTQKVMAYAAIAAALAATGGVNNTVKTDDAQVATPAEGKDSLKNKPAAAAAAKAPAKAAPAPAVAKEAPAAPAANPEPELTEDWTEDTMELLKAELEFVQAKQVEYGDAVLDDCVKAFSEGVHNSVSDINPMNIKGFVAYIEQCEADQQSA